MKRAWSARTITTIRGPKKGKRPVSENRWFSLRNFSSFYLKGEIAEQLVISGVLLKPWTLVKPSPIDFPALFTGCVFICVLIGLSLTTSLLRSAGHAVSCCHVTWRKILRLKWRQVVAIRALFLFSFICFAMTQKSTCDHWRTVNACCVISFSILFFYQTLFQIYFFHLRRK